MYFFLGFSQLGELLNSTRSEDCDIYVTQLISVLFYMFIIISFLCITIVVFDMLNLIQFCLPHGFD